MLFFPFFRLESSNSELGGDWNECLNPGLSDFTTQTLFTNRCASSRQKGDYRFQNMIHKYSHFSPLEINTLSFSAGQHFLLLSGSKHRSLKRKKSTSFSKERPRKARLSTLILFSSAAASHPHLRCVEDVMVRCYFPLALLLKITARDCDKWIFPLNSLVEWDIPLTTGTIPTQVKHWVIFFLMNKKSKGKKERIYSNYLSYFFFGECIMIAIYYNYL